MILSDQDAFLPDTYKADLEACPTEEILLVGDPDKVHGEQWFFTYTAEAFEAQLTVLQAGEKEEQARLEAEAEVRIRRTKNE